MFRCLAKRQMMSQETIDVLVRSWQPETYRHMRHSWTELKNYLEANHIDEAELLGPNGTVDIHNFKSAYAKTGKGSVEAVFSHCNTLRATLCGDGSATASRLLRAVRRARPKPKKKFDTIWNIQDLLQFIERKWPDNDALDDDTLLTKALALTMIYTGCRLKELTTMKLKREAILTDSLVVEMQVKTNLQELWPVEVKATSRGGQCPHATIACWFERCAHPGGLLFPEPKSGDPLTYPQVVARLQNLLHDAGIHGYPAYSIKHAVVTYLFNSGVDERQVNEFGRWSAASRVADRHYRIGRSRDTWLGYRIAGGANRAAGPEARSGSTAEVDEPTEASGLAAASL
jgi:site-specific recombinase XerD